MTCRPLQVVAAVLAMTATSPCQQLPALRVMPVGDSITEANNGDTTYRYYLCAGMAAAGLPMDLVGSRRGVWTGRPRFGNFDQDHEGHWGWRTDELLPHMRGWARANPPEVALIHLGTNDILQRNSTSSTLTELGKIIDEMRMAKPDVVVLLARLIPIAPRYGVSVNALNARLPTLVASKTTAASPVVLIDQHTGFSPQVHTYDGLHPNQLGEQRMATVWFDALRTVFAQRVGLWGKFGRGCAAVGAAVGAGSGSAVRIAAAPGRPRLGARFSIMVHGLPRSGAPVLGFLGASRTRWLGLRLPLDLGPVGMPGCSLHVSPDVVVPLAAVGHSAQWTLPIPPDPRLIGAWFFQQAMVFEPVANRFGALTSDAGVARIGGW